MSLYDDPHVSAGEIADYLDQLRLEATPLPQLDAPLPETASSSSQVGKRYLQLLEAPQSA